MKVLVAEDERKVRLFLRDALVQAGMVVEEVENCDDLLVAVSTTHYDLLILDRLLGAQDAVTTLQELRAKHPELRILVLSALEAVKDRVRGLTEGADDYLGKPFHVAELIARIRSLTRRHAGEELSPDTLIRYNDLCIDLEKQKVSRTGTPIELTRKEFQILVLLARVPGKVYSKTALLNEAWDLNHVPESNIVEVTIANLRSKVDRQFIPLIQSQRGVGYWLGQA